MTEEKLVKEAEQYATQFTFYKQVFAKKNFLSAAEPREKQIDELSRKCDKLIADKLVMTATYNEVLNDLNQQNDNLQKENAELEQKLETERKSRIALVGKVAELEKRCANYEMKLSKMEKGTCDVCKETESLENVKNIYIGDLLKAKEIIKYLLAFVYIHGNFSGDIFDKAMEFIKD